MEHRSIRYRLSELEKAVNPGCPGCRESENPAVSQALHARIRPAIAQRDDPGWCRQEAAG